MSSKIFVLPYMKGSKSAKALAEAINGKRIKLENTRFKPTDKKVVINWGNSNPPVDVGHRVLNDPLVVGIAANKLSFFNTLKEYNDNVLEDEQVRHVPFTTDTKQVNRWLAKGQTVVARDTLTGHSGQGIRILDKMDDYYPAKLYTMYVKKKSEYRIHVMDGEVFDVQRKARKMEVVDEQVNWMIRNRDNGFVFARNEGLGDVPADVLEQAKRAMKAVCLDFGGVDVIYNEHENQAYVVEINTACGLEGETLDNYVNQFRKLLGE